MHIIYFIIIMSATSCVNISSDPAHVIFNSGINTKSMLSCTTSFTTWKQDFWYFHTNKLGLEPKKNVYKGLIFFIIMSYVSPTLKR